MFKRCSFVASGLACLLLDARFVRDNFPPGWWLVGPGGCALSVVVYGAYLHRTSPKSSEGGERVYVLGYLLSLAGVFLAFFSRAVLRWEGFGDESVQRIALSVLPSICGLAVMLTWRSLEREGPGESVDKSMEEVAEAARELKVSLERIPEVVGGLESALIDVERVLPRVQEGLKSTADQADGAAGTLGGMAQALTDTLTPALTKIVETQQTLADQVGALSGNLGQLSRNMDSLSSHLAALDTPNAAGLTPAQQVAQGMSGAAVGITAFNASVGATGVALDAVKDKADSAGEILEGVAGRAGHLADRLRDAGTAAEGILAPALAKIGEAQGTIVTQTEVLSEHLGTLAENMQALLAQFAALNTPNSAGLAPAQQVVQGMKAAARGLTAFDASLGLTGKALQGMQGSAVGVENELGVIVERSAQVTGSLDGLVRVTSENLAPALAGVVEKQREIASQAGVLSTSIEALAKQMNDLLANLKGLSKQDGKGESVIAQFGAQIGEASGNMASLNLAISNLSRMVSGMRIAGGDGDGKVGDGRVEPLAPPEGNHTPGGRADLTGEGTRTPGGLADGHKPVERHRPRTGTYVPPAKAAPQGESPEVGPSHQGAGGGGWRSFPVVGPLWTRLADRLSKGGSRPE